MNEIIDVTRYLKSRKDKKILNWLSFTVSDKPEFRAYKEIYIFLLKETTGLQDIDILEMYAQSNPTISFEPDELEKQHTLQDKQDPTLRPLFVVKMYRPTVKGSSANIEQIFGEELVFAMELFTLFFIQIGCFYSLASPFSDIELQRFYVPSLSPSDVPQVVKVLRSKKNNYSIRKEHGCFSKVLIKYLSEKGKDGLERGLFDDYNGKSDIIISTVSQSIKELKNTLELPIIIGKILITEFEKHEQTLLNLDFPSYYESVYAHSMMKYMISILMKQTDNFTNWWNVEWDNNYTTFRTYVCDAIKTGIWYQDEIKNKYSRFTEIFECLPNVITNSNYYSVASELKNIELSDNEKVIAIEQFYSQNEAYKPGLHFRGLLIYSHRVPKVKFPKEAYRSKLDTLKKNNLL